MNEEYETRHREDGTLVTRKNTLAPPWWNDPPDRYQDMHFQPEDERSALSKRVPRLVSALRGRGH